jgi:hypothetical protein
MQYVSCCALTNLHSYQTRIIILFLSFRFCFQAKKTLTVDWIVNLVRTGMVYVS